MLFRSVIADAQVFLEVFLGVLQAVLRLGRDHAAKLSKVSAHFVYHIHARDEVVAMMVRYEK